MNCVNTNIRLMSELMQFEIGMSTNRYFPAIGTAGFDRLSVNGYKREPCPPPKIMANVLFFIGISFRGTHYISSLLFLFLGTYSALHSRFFLPSKKAKKELRSGRGAGIIFETKLTFYYDINSNKILSTSTNLSLS